MKKEVVKKQNLKTKWELKKLEDLGNVNRGKSRHRPRNDPVLYGGNYPFIQTSNIKEATLYIRKYSQTYNEKGLAQSKLWEPGILCITIAANIAETAILDLKACFPDSIIGFKPYSDIANVYFVKYLIDYMKQLMQSISHGTTQGNLSITKLKSIDFKVPPFNIQKKIATTLSAYDELIENNNKRIKLLEEMAQAIYKEWFVNFKFPGHENVKMMDSELGKIPEGWEDLKLTKEVDFQRGVEPGSDNYMKKYTLGLVPFLRVGDFSSTPSEIYISEELAKGRILNKRDIAITLDGTVGIVKMGKKGAYSSGIQKVIIKKNSILTWSFLYCLLKSSQIQNTIKKHASGTTILHAASSKKYIKLIKPPKKLIDDFENTVGNLLRLRLNLQEKNKTLKRTRDILLPKLISGEIDVSDLDIEVIE